jgi:CheY-like chemotaxis protein
MSGSVLIVDDDVNARIIAETLLEARGLRVRTAEGGAQACEIARRGDTEVVVVDLTSPGTNGLEVIRQLRARFEFPRLPTPPRIIALTDTTQPEVERFARRLGAEICLQKPTLSTHLITAVEQLLAAAGSPSEAA